MLYPLKFNPVYKNYLWGGRNLEKFGRTLPEGKVAESWDLSCHPDGVSIVANGAFEGQSLPELLKIQKSRIIGDRFSNAHIEQFPLLIKLIDANDRLSVQVHPDDEYAAVYEEGGLGKNEMWYILDAKPGAKLVYGVAPGVTREGFEEALKDNRLESCLRYVEVRAGDVVNIPAGVVHAIGEGIVLAEIQQSSNTTYRVYDYDRVDSEGKKRALHVRQALEVIKFEPSGRKEKAVGLTVELDASSRKTYVVANRFFAAELYNVNGKTLEKANGSKFHIYIFTEGEGKIEYYSGGFTGFKTGETVLIPAHLGDYTLQGAFKALKAYIPDLKNDIVDPLRAAGHSQDSIYKMITD